MSMSQTEGYNNLIGNLRAQLSQEIAVGNEEPITVDGKPVDYLVYSHFPEERRLGYKALVAALDMSPSRARYGLLAFVNDEDYGVAALDAIHSSYEV